MGVEKLWLVVKSLKQDKGLRGCRLVEGDIMKIRQSHLSD